MCVHKCTRQMDVGIERNSWMAELVECEVITVKKPKGFGSFDYVNSEKATSLSLKIILMFFFPIQEISRHRYALPIYE